MQITVCGAGPAGLGMSACLMSGGHAVTLYDMPDYADRVLPFAKEPTLVSRGMLEYTGRFAAAVTDSAAALKDAEVILVTTHAGAHHLLAKLFAGKLREGQVMVFSPGYVGGGVEFNSVLERAGHKPVPYEELSSLPVIAKGESQGCVRISAWKRGLILYRPQELDGHPVSKWLADMFSPLKISRHPVEPGLNEINFIVHSVVSLLNASLVERNQPWCFYRDGLTPGIMRIVELIDEERVELERALGYTPHPLTDLLSEFYSDQGMCSNGLYSQLSTFEPFAKVPGPLRFDSRFISEDLAYGLVPMAWLGQAVGLRMTYTNMIIQLAQGFTGRDYLLEGRRIAP